jgi:hypothetical protein
MGSFKALGFLSAAIVVAGSGCGTMANMEGKKLPLLSPVDEEEPRPFGGVGRDIRWISRLNPPSLIFVPDIPLSLIGDLATLPRALRKKPHANQPTQPSNRGGLETDRPERSEFSPGDPIH